MNQFYTETNFVVDFLANSAISLPVGLHIFNSPPLGAELWVHHDCIGVPYRPKIVESIIREMIKKSLYY